MLLQTANPFAAGGDAALSPGRSTRERFRNAVFAVLAAHVVLVLGLLMGGNTEPSAKSIAGTYAGFDRPAKSTQAAAVTPQGAAPVRLTRN